MHAPLVTRSGCRPHRHTNTHSHTLSSTVNLRECTREQHSERETRALHKMRRGGGGKNSNKNNKRKINAVQARAFYSLRCPSPPPPLSLSLTLLLHKSTQQLPTLTQWRPLSLAHIWRIAISMQN